MVGAEDIASLKVAVILTTLEPETKLSESVSVRVTVGAVLSIVSYIQLILPSTIAKTSVPATVADTMPLVVVETVKG